MSRGRIPLCTLLGLFWALVLRALGDDWIPRTASSWALWLLTGAGAGYLALIAARPTRGWNWLWRPLLVGLGYGVSGLMVFPLFWLTSAALHLPMFRPTEPASPVKLPVASSAFSASLTQTDAQFTVQIVSALAFMVLIGASFCHLLSLRRSGA